MKILLIALRDCSTCRYRLSPESGRYCSFNLYVDGDGEEETFFAQSLPSRTVIASDKRRWSAQSNRPSGVAVPNGKRVSWEPMIESTQFRPRWLKFKFIDIHSRSSTSDVSTELSSRASTLLSKKPIFLGCTHNCFNTASCAVYLGRVSGESWNVLFRSWKNKFRWSHRRGQQHDEHSFEILPKMFAKVSEVENFISLPERFLIHRPF